MDLGNRIKAVRREKHLTQQVFADKLGLKRNTVGGNWNRHAQRQDHHRHLPRVQR